MTTEYDSWRCSGNLLNGKSNSDDDDDGDY